MTLANGKGTGYKGLMGITEALGAGKALIEVSKLARDLINHPDVQNNLTGYARLFRK